MTEEETEKQEFLQKEIIDKKYDHEGFIRFCLSKKPNGDDLDSYTMEELTAMVKEFQAQEDGQGTSQGTENQNNQEEKIDSNQNPPENTIESNQENKEGEEENKGNVNIEDLASLSGSETKPKKNEDVVIQCKKLLPTQLSNNQINIIIQNPKSIDSGILGKNYTMYEVLTEPFSWHVTRRFSDFEWLRKMLIKFYPGLSIPPLPAKKIGNKRFEEKFIQKRQKFLEMFINSVCKREDFKCCEALVAFLSFEERPKFERKMRELLTFQPSTYLEEYRTLTGTAITNHEEANEKYFINIGKYFNLQEKILEKLNANLKSFYKSYESAIESLDGIQKNMNVLYVLNTRVLMKHQITKTCDELSLFFRNWKLILVKQNEVVKEKIKDFFKFIRLEGQAYTELIKMRNDMKSKYNSEKQKLDSKKEKLFATKDISKYETNPDDNRIDLAKLTTDKKYAFEHMCFKDNQNVAMMYNQLGYLNKTTITELKAIIKGYCKRYIDNFKVFDTQFYPTLNNFIETWTNLETHVQSCISEEMMAKMQKEAEQMMGQAENKGEEGTA